MLINLKTLKLDSSNCWKKEMKKIKRTLIQKINFGKLVMIVSMWKAVYVQLGLFYWSEHYLWSYYCNNITHKIMSLTAELAPGATTGKTWIFIIHAANDYCSLLYVINVNLSLSLFQLQKLFTWLYLLWFAKSEAEAMFTEWLLLAVSDKGSHRKNSLLSKC